MMHCLSTPQQPTIRRLIPQLGLIGLWAMLWGLSYPPVNWWVLAHLALAPLTLLALRGAPRRRLVGLVYLAGVIWWLVMVRWLLRVTTPGYIALALLLGLFPMTFVLVLPAMRRATRLPCVLLVPLIWVALEYVRTWLTIGFGWFLIGHSQPTVMIQIADTLGAYGVSFVVAASGGLIVDLVIHLPQKGAPRPATNGSRPRSMGRSMADFAGHGARRPTLLGSLAIWAILIGGTLAYGYWRLNQPIPYSKTVRVAVVQTNVPQSLKNHPTLRSNRRRFMTMLRLSRRALRHSEKHDPALIAWPETMVPQPLNDDAVALLRRFVRYPARRPDYRARIAAFADRHETAMIVGAGARIYELRGLDWVMSDRYNSAYFFTSEGRLAGRYDKIHRVPFGEYLPIVSGLPWLKQVFMYFAPYEHFYSLTAGREYDRFMIDRSKHGTPPIWFATPICFEDVVSYVPRNMVYEDGRKVVDLLVNITNDGWYPVTPENPQHQQIARFRCVENRVPMARAVNTGISGFIDSYGRIRETVQVRGRRRGVAGVAVHVVKTDPRVTIFGRIGNAFAQFTLIVTLAMGAFTAWRLADGPRE